MTPNGIKRCAIYARVSTQEQENCLQLNELTEFISKRHGWVIEQVYQEKASGRSSNRPQLKALLKACRERKIDVVVCWKLDRWFRSLKEIVVTLQELGELGIEFVSMKDNIDMTTSAGKLMTHILAAFSEWEVSILRERVKSGLQAAKARGVILGRPQVVTTDVEREIISLRKSGLSLRKIEQALGKRVSKTSILRVLKNHGGPQRFQSNR